MPLVVFRAILPTVGRDVFVAPGAWVLGDVTLGDNVNVWFGASVRGDTERIEIGEGTSVQDCAVLHTDPGKPLAIGARVVIGHGAIVHGATVGDECLVGMGSTLLNGCVIREGSIVGANSLVTQGKEFPANSLIVGAPAQVVREVTEADREVYRELADRYRNRALEYLRYGLGDLSLVGNLVGQERAVAAVRASAAGGTPPPPPLTPARGLGYGHPEEEPLPEPAAPPPPGSSESVPFEGAPPKQGEPGQSS